MAYYTDLAIYKAAYDLLLSFSKLVPGMSKAVKHTLCHDASKRMTDLIVCVYRANRSRSEARLTVFAEMRSLLVESEVMLRLLHDMGHLPHKQYLMLAEKCSGVSAQLDGWEKYQRKNSVGGESGA